MAFDLAKLAADPFVRRIEFRSEAESTNTLALELAAQGAGPTPLLVLAERQRAGRGRGVNRWWSSEGSLTFSLLLETESINLPASRWPLVSLVSALAVGEALAARAPQQEITLKWPNDVFLSGRKVCGILVETPAVRPPRLVVGLGVNVNNSLAGAPAELRSTAAALCDECPGRHDTQELLLAILQQFAAEWQRLGQNAEQLAQRWQPRCHLRGRTVHLASGARRLVGLCQGVADDGAILLRTETGLERCLAGTVERFE